MRLQHLAKRVKILINPWKWFACIVYILDNTVFYRKIPDRVYLRCVYYLSVNEKLDLNNPKNFNQKIQWLKIYYKNPLYIKLADKYAVREYVKNKVGDKYLIPIFGVWDRFAQIDFNALPNQFVLKCNHDCGSVIICNDKGIFDIQSAQNKIEKCLKVNYCDNSPYREWQYRDIQPKIIAEKYICSTSGEQINDYKFFCFNGTPKILYVSSDLHTKNQKVTFFDFDWHVLDIDAGFQKINPIPKKPEVFDEMIYVCKSLSQEIPFVRVDLYLAENKIYFSELTFTPHGGYYPFNPPEWNKTLGDWLQLPPPLT